MVHSDHLASYVSASLGVASPRTALLDNASQESRLDQGDTVTADDDRALITRLAEQGGFPAMQPASKAGSAMKGFANLSTKSSALLTSASPMNAGMLIGSSTSLLSRRFSIAPRYLLESFRRRCRISTSMEPRNA